MLRALAAPALAGCLAAPDTTAPASPSPAGDDAIRRVPMGRTVTLDGASMTIASPLVRSQVVANGPAHQTPLDRADRYVVVDVTTEGPVGRDPDLRGAVDGEARPESGPIPTAPVSGEAAPLDPREWAAAPVAFPFPAGRHDTAAIRWARGGATVLWDLPEAVLEALVGSPSFVVESLEPTRRDGELALSFTVANEGTRAGRFVASVSFEGFSGSDTVAFDVPAGTTRTHVARPKVLLYLENTGGGTVTVRVPTGDGYDVRELEVAATPTTEGG